MVGSVTIPVLGLLCCGLSRVVAVHRTERHPGRVDHKQLSHTQQETQACIGRLLCPGLEFPLAAHVPGNSCTAPRRHGRITHQPEDGPHGGFGPDMPCNPPLSHGSSSFEVHDRRTREFRALHRWKCLTISCEALRALVPLRPLWGPPPCPAR